MRRAGRKVAGNVTRRSNEVLPPVNFARSRGRGASGPSSPTGHSGRENGTLEWTFWDLEIARRRRRAEWGKLADETQGDSRLRCTRDRTEFREGLAKPRKLWSPGIPYEVGAGPLRSSPIKRSKEGT